MARRVALFLALFLSFLPGALGDGIELATIPPEGNFDRPFAPGVSFLFTAEINRDGTARTVDTEDSYFSVEIMVVVKRILNPSYYRAQYQNLYQLTGTEACCVLEVTLISSTGPDTIVPQDAVMVGLCDDMGNLVTGYQMMDLEIGGEPKVKVRVGETRELFKRFPFQQEPPLTRLFLTYYVNGESQTVYFTLVSPYETLAKGNTEPSDAVLRLQTALIAKGYLTGEADGLFGSRTEEAVKKAQTDAGLPVTGIAESQLQEWLYGE